MREGTEIIYRAPADPSVWYQPQTLIWYAILVALPVLILVVLRGRRSHASRSESHEAKDADTFPPDRAEPQRRGPTMLDTGIVFAYSIALLVTCLLITNATGDRLRGRDAVVVSTDPGLPAAVAFLTIPAIALFASSLITLAYAGHKRSAIEGTGLFAVVWLFGGGVGCLFASPFAAIAGSTYASFYAGLGALLLALGLWRRSVRGPSGRTVIERAEAAERADLRIRAAAEAERAPPKGRYIGMAPLRYWGRLVLLFLFPSVFFGGFILATGGEGRWRDLLEVFPFSSGFGLIFALMLWLSSMRMARHVVWDEEGFEVTWYRGLPLRFAWSDMDTFKEDSAEVGVVRAGRGPSGEGIYVRTTSGHSFRAGSSFDNYEALKSAFLAHAAGDAEPRHDDGD